MALVEQIMPGALQRGRYMSSGQTRVEYAERFWRANPYHAVEEGDWCFPGVTSGFWSSQRHKAQEWRSAHVPENRKASKQSDKDSEGKAQDCDECISYGAHGGDGAGAKLLLLLLSVHHQALNCG